VFTLGGGDITMVSQYGNIDAGRGSKTASSAPPPLLTTDEKTGNTKIDISGSISGSGIATLKTSDKQPASDVVALAPRGIFDAGDAGVRSTGKVQIEAAVAESDIARVQVGQKVGFTVDAYGTREFAGTVSQVRLIPTTQQYVVTFIVVVDVFNPDGALLPGMTVNAEFLVKAYEKVLLVPNAAMSWKPADWKRPRAQPGSRTRDAGKAEAGFQSTIFVLGADGKPAAREIRLGAADKDMSVVLGGNLKAGELVITGDIDPKEAADAPSGGPPPGRG
jgi:multidrug efflux pump subunit AcrA (membrane-fusion protein)